MIDVSNITPAADSYVARAADDRNYALELVEKKKNEKYVEAYREGIGEDFLPFVTAHSRQQDPWGDQAARQLELYEDISGHEKRILRD